MFNRQEGINGGVKEYPNQVVVVNQKGNGWQDGFSEMKAHLSGGGQYTKANFGGWEETLVIKVCEIVYADDVDYADVIVDFNSDGVVSCDEAPTPNETSAPTSRPTRSPTRSPTKSPSNSPTKSPSNSPTKSKETSPPTSSPTRSPTSNPTKSPTNTPTKSKETSPPTSSPTRSPTSNPTKSPTNSPTKSPTNTPTKYPTPISTPTICKGCKWRNASTLKKSGTRAKCFKKFQVKTIVAEDGKCGENCVEDASCAYKWEMSYQIKTKNACKGNWWKNCEFGYFDQVKPGATPNDPKIFQIEQKKGKLTAPTANVACQCETHTKRFIMQCPDYKGIIDFDYSCSACEKFIEPKDEF